MYKLPDALRKVFRDPFGPVYATEELRAHVEPKSLLIAIGDMVAKTALDLGLAPKIIIVDFKTQRGPVEPPIRTQLTSYGKTMLRVKNPAATITKQLVSAVQQALRLEGTVRIEVDGEEDLAGLPVFAYAPNGATILYGLPKRGIVLVRMDESMRRMSHELLDQMRA